MHGTPRCDDGRLVSAYSHATATAASLSDPLNTAMGSFAHQTVICPHRGMHVRKSPQSDTVPFKSFSVLTRGRRLSRASIYLALPAGTTPSLPRFSRMRIREENCNMVLLAAVASVSVAIAGGATLLGFAGNKPAELTDRAADRVEQATLPDKRIIHVGEQPPVRVVGAPFVPNTNPRER